MSRLSAAKRVEVCAHLVEQCSVRGTGRLCGVYKRTVTDLLVKLGLGCTRLHDRLVRGLPIWRIEVDELTAPVHTRQKNLPWMRIRRGTISGRIRPSRLSRSSWSPSSTESAQRPHRRVYVGSALALYGYP